MTIWPVGEGADGAGKSRRIVAPVHHTLYRSIRSRFLRHVVKKRGVLETELTAILFTFAEYMDLTAPHSWVGCHHNLASVP